MEQNYFFAVISQLLKSSHFFHILILTPLICNKAVCDLFLEQTHLDCMRASLMYVYEVSPVNQRSIGAVSLLTAPCNTINTCKTRSFIKAVLSFLNHFTYSRFYLCWTMSQCVANYMTSQYLKADDNVSRSVITRTIHMKQNVNQQSAKVTFL